MYPSSSNGFAVPFVRQLDGTFHPGRVIAFSGSIPTYASRFELNLQCGGAAADKSDLALHVSVRFDEHAVVRNTRLAGGWQHEERGGGMPASLRRGTAFQMLVRCEPHAFKIAFNGLHFGDFRHRLPYQRVTHVSACKDVQISSVSGVLGPCLPSPGFPSHGFPGPGSPGHPQHQVHNPAVPYKQMIGSIFPGRFFRVKGFVPYQAYRFSVNLATGPSMTMDDIALHVSTRPSEGLVELNTCRRGGWESGTQRRPCPVRGGEHFEMLVKVDDQNYKIAFNGVHFAEWPHRHPWQYVCHLIIEGDVQLQLVAQEGQPRAAPSHYPNPYGAY